MSLDPSLEDQEILAETLQTERSELPARELIVAALLAVAFAAASTAIWVLHPPQSFPAVACLACVAVLAVSARVQIDTPLGFTVPTQLAFVPLLMVSPLATVAPLMLAALVIPAAPAVLSGRLPLSRLLQHPANASFALGPVVVFAATGVVPARASALLLLGALAAQFATDFAVSTVRFGIALRASLAAQLRSWWVYAIDAGLAALGWVLGVMTETRPLAVLTLLPLLALLSLLARERRKRLRGMLELSQAYRGTALVLGDVVQADDGYTGEHSKGVVRLAAEVGEKLELSAERRRNLEFAALLHDVGKIAVPKMIINKPGKLSPEEWLIIKTHTLEGQRMLDRVGGFMHDVGMIVRSHHERWDGAGYPDGLTGEEIPLEARIIACCDTWNAMRTDRAYRRALPRSVALAELTAGSGTQFDPGVIACLLEIIAAEAASRSELPARPPAAMPPALAAGSRG